MEDLNRITLIGSVEQANYDANTISFKLVTKDIARNAKTKKKVEKLVFHNINCSKNIIYGVITKDTRVFVEGAVNCSEDNSISEIEAHVVEVLGEKRSMN